MIEFLKYLWQFPQNFIAWMYFSFLLDKSMILAIGEHKGIRVYTKSSSGCVSLGKYIFVSPYVPDDIIKHEWGHTRQSLMLGPLYLIIIGIPSILWAATHKLVAPGRNYYQFYTEAWANKLGGVNLK